MKPKCPRCNTAKHVRAVGVCGDLFHCGKCGGTFDNDPNEGSDVHADPSRRMELQERQQQRQRERNQQRNRR